MRSFIAIGIVAVEVFALCLTWQYAHWSVALLLTMHFIREMFNAIIRAAAEMHERRINQALASLMKEMADKKAAQ